MLAYLKSHDKFYEEISMKRCLSSEEILRFYDIAEIQWEWKCHFESHRKDYGKNHFGSKRNEWKYKWYWNKMCLAADSLSMYRTTVNATILVSEILSIINEENVIIALEQGKTTFNSKWWILWRASISLSSSEG